MSEKNDNEIEETVAVKTFKSLAKVPSYVSADILPDSDSSLLLIQTSLSQRDFTRKVKRTVVKQLVVSLHNDDGSLPKVINTSAFPSIDRGDMVLQAKSPSDEKLVTLRSVSNGKGKSRYVEVWKHGNLESAIDVTNTHEDFYTDDEFGCLKWSKDEKKVVYIAERKALEESNEKKFDYVPDWGEKLVNRRVPVIVVVDVDDSKAKVLPEFHSIDPGQGRASRMVFRALRAFISIGGAEFVLINSYWRSRKSILAVNLISGKVQNLTSTGSWTLFTAWDKYIVASQGFPNKFHQLNIGIINGAKDKEDNLDVNWVVVDQPYVEEGAAKTLSKNASTILQPFADKPNLEVILHQPSETSSGRKPPLIVLPHGGPHTSSIAELSLYIQTLVSLGYAIIEVNYSGSTGFGQDYIDALIGKIGDLDIEEVQASAQYFIDNNYVDRDSVAVIGGSHGGFISGHLIGKFPDFYKACVMRNPVLNIGGLPYDLKKPSIVRPSDYAKMYESSPIANIDNIKTPILLMLGQGDKRVPHVDGLQWWYYLKAQRKVDVRCKMYGETGHSLDTIEAEVSGIDEKDRVLPLTARLDEVETTVMRQREDLDTLTQKVDEIIKNTRTSENPNSSTTKLHKDDQICQSCHSSKSDEWCPSCDPQYFIDRFSDWTSGNPDVDRFIRATQRNATSRFNFLEWIPYTSLKDVKYIGKGGFGKISSAIWIDGPRSKWMCETGKWGRYPNVKVALKSIESKDVVFEELQSYLHANKNVFGRVCTLRIYGLTRNPDDPEKYIIVMLLADDGDLGQYIKKNFSKLTYQKKLEILFDMITGILQIHKVGLVHRDLHRGNVLCQRFIKLDEGRDEYRFAIGDLGLTRKPSSDSKTFYGIIPYCAPEVLEYAKYSLASDIYSFGIIMWELISGVQAFSNREHDKSLMSNIISGLRPQPVPHTPNSYEILMKRCWAPNPDNRPSAQEIYATIGVWLQNLSFTPYKGISQEFLEADEKRLVRLPVEELSSDAKYCSTTYHTINRMGFSPISIDPEPTDYFHVHKSSMQPTLVMVKPLVG
ncbi:12274_t:CDS:10 [Acaulospora colombiana]|uniref:12274_t:CDS:1 n=1 Tax=Acaulospora colombiana TaxID=27376 RepID=A0ACA9L3V5_9GLOM|nr:12274_t:CDS:10 [Acaulospora colombiana]